VELKREILKLVVKDFVAMDNKWKRNLGRFKTRTLAIYFRKLNKDTALYLLRIHPQLYFTTTNLLKGRGLTLCHGQTTVSDRVQGSWGLGISDKIMKTVFGEGLFPKGKLVT